MDNSFKIEAPVKSITFTPSPVVTVQKPEKLVEYEIPTTSVRMERTETQEPMQNNAGKIYTELEINDFKRDMYNSYVRQLKAKGVDEDKIEEFAKRLVAQDAHESKWGRSSLSREFNFGGIKGNSSNGVSRPT